MQTPVVVIPDSLTPEQFARKLGISRKRFLEIKAITDKVLAENAPRYQTSVETPSESGHRHSVQREASPRANQRKAKGKP